MQLIILSLLSPRGPLPGGTATVGRARAPHMELLPVGAPFPQGALSRLGAAGNFAALFFIDRDDAFDCAKQLLALSEKASEFRVLGCSRLVVVRPASGASAGSAARFPLLSFVEDEADEARLAVGLGEAVGLFGRRARASLLVAANGTVVGAVSDQIDAVGHVRLAQQCVERVEAERLEKAEGPARRRVEALRQLVTAASALSEEEAATEDEAEARRADAALRAQSLLAEAKRATLFGGPSLREALEQLERREAEGAEAARTDAALARAEAALAAAAGDARADESVARARAESAMSEWVRFLEDVLSLVRLRSEAWAEEVLAPSRMAAEADEREAATRMRRAGSRREQAARAEAALESREQASKASEALANWAAQQAAEEAGREAGRREAEGYRAAVEAAWAESEGGAAGATGGAAAPRGGECGEPAIGKAQPSEPSRRARDPLRRALDNWLDPEGAQEARREQAEAARTQPPRARPAVRESRRVGSEEAKVSSLVPAAEKEEAMAASWAVRAAAAREQVSAAERELERLQERARAAEAAVERAVRGEGLV